MGVVAPMKTVENYKTSSSFGKREFYETVIGKSERDRQHKTEIK